MAGDHLQMTIYALQEGLTPFVNNRNTPNNISHSNSLYLLPSSEPLQILLPQVYNHVRELPPRSYRIWRSSSC